MGGKPASALTVHIRAPIGVLAFPQALSDN